MTGSLPARNRDRRLAGPAAIPPVAGHVIGHAVFPAPVPASCVADYEGDLVYSLAQAAKAAGKSKPTVARAIKAGRLSATRAGDGSYAIDPAELSRVFQFAGDIAGPMKQSVPGNGAGPYPVAAPGEIDGLRLLLAEREETIRDLRRRLDASEEERRRVQERLTGFLTHRQAGSVPATGSASNFRGPWWQRWLS